MGRLITSISALAFLAGCGISNRHNLTSDEDSLSTRKALVSAYAADKSMAQDLKLLLTAQEKSRLYLLGLDDEAGLQVNYHLKKLFQNDRQFVRAVERFEAKHGIEYDGDPTADTPTTVGGEIKQGPSIKAIQKNHAILVRRLRAIGRR